MYLNPEDLLKMLLAVVAGGLIGLERELRDKAAGFRTLIFICAGATLFTILSTRLAAGGEPTRIAANIVVGVGFLGAGVILREGGRVVGLTTAAAVWLTAALGMALGGGEYALAGLGLAVSLVVLGVFPWFERRVEQVSETHTYEVVCGPNYEKLLEVEVLFHRQGLRASRRGQARTGDALTGRWEVHGAPKRHEQMARQLLADVAVREFRLLDRVAS